MEPLYHLTTRAMVVPTGVEPVTSWMSTKRSTAELRNQYGESYGNRTRINGITIRGVDRYTNNSICGLACRNRTHIQEVEALCIIHYTKARNGRGYRIRTCAWRNQNPLPYRAWRTPNKLERDRRIELLTKPWQGFV